MQTPQAPTAPTQAPGSKDVLDLSGNTKAPPALSVEKQVLRPRSKRGKYLKILLAGIIVATIGVGVYFYYNGGLSGSRNNPGDQEQKYTFEYFPSFQGVPINENTISFSKVDGKFCLRYKGLIYTPQDTGSLDPKVKQENEETREFPWYGLVDAPANLISESGPGDVIFSFKDSPSRRSFVFITRWQTESGERYHMYRFHNDSFSELRVFSRAAGVFWVPKVTQFSLGGNFLNIGLFRCATCLNEVPETLLYFVPTGEIKNIGQTSYFEWGADDNEYQYKPYVEGVDPADLPMRRNEFFERSIELLDLQD